MLLFLSLIALLLVFIAAWTGIFGIIALAVAFLFFTARLAYLKIFKR